MARDPIPTWFFALVVVRHAERFLMVHERKHGQLWYIPAGRAEPGESLPAAAVRETLEETGVAVQLTGVIRMEHSARADSARVRVVFLAKPVGDPTPKTAPDGESLGAEWVSLAELDRYPLRGWEVEELLQYVAAAGDVHPLDVLTAEGAPYVQPP